jgi:hypothetical protein
MAGMAQVHKVRCPEHGELPCPVCIAALYGKKGGATAAERMSAKQRKERASKAAKARWAKRRTATRAAD